MSDYLFKLTEKEEGRQKSTISLIASENLPSPAVIDLLGGSFESKQIIGKMVRSIWSNKYGEGYPGKRYYAGNQYTDELEKYGSDLALQVFAKDLDYGVNMQMNSGSMANMMVYLSVLNYGDTVVSLDVSSGGHISHLHSTSNWRKFFKYANYGLIEISPNCFEIDFDDYCQKIIENKPKLVIIGCSSYPRAIKNYDEMIQFAHLHGAFVLCDIAHINGLVAAGLHPSPFKIGENGADFVTMTTHKTLRGPRGALLFFKNQFADIVNKTVFPGTSGGPHFNKIAAVSRCLEEILGIEKYPSGTSFIEYTQNVIRQTKLMENTLLECGLEIISPTQTHLMLVKLPLELDSLKIQQKLEEIGIITNRNSIPNETKSMWRPSGLRLGTAGLTSRDCSDQDIILLSKLIGRVILAKFDGSDIENENKTNKFKLELGEIVSRLKWWY